MIRIIALLIALVTPAAFAQVPPKAARAASPTGVLALEVTTDDNGRPIYSLTRRGKLIIAPSSMGFLLTDAPKLQRDMALTAQAQRSAAERWEQPWGENRYVQNRYNELRTTFAEKAAPRRTFDVVFRLYDDGVGFRYDLPVQPNLKTLNAAEELTEFNVARTGEAWWIPGGDWNRYEQIYAHAAIDAVSTAHTPMTMKLDDGTHLSFHEAALVDYSGYRLWRVEGQRFQTALAPSGRGAAKVTRVLPFATPWRTIRIADDAAGLYASNLELNLNEPNKLGGMGWFTPFKYVGVWWEMHLGRSTWASGPQHGANTANTKRYIDFAAKNGFRGVLVEGWNRGWDGRWFGDGSQFSFTESYPDFDLKAVTDYARRKRVRLMGHHETGGDIATYERQLGAALDLYAKRGVDSVKTGYVADAGGLQDRDAAGKPIFEWHDGQRSSRHHLRVVTEAAKRKIAINPHEPIKDTGLRRTYPNWVSREGARGGEFQAWGSPKNPPSHAPTLVFTRMLSGPMDYTPGIVSLKGVDSSNVPSTVARELALYVVLYSPIQMAADLPENYLARPDALQFIKDVAVDWAETRILNGEVGRYATVARRDRNSANWFVGAVTDENARTLPIALNFLDGDRSYEAEIYADGARADYRNEGRHKLVVSKRVVKRGDKLPLVLAPGGGAAVRLRAR